MLPLLQTQQHQNLSFAFFQWFKRLANQGSGAMKLDAADINRLGLHGHAWHVAGDQQIADVNGALAGINLNQNSAGGGDQNFASAAFPQSDARLFRDHSGHARVIGLRRRNDLIGFG